MSGARRGGAGDSEGDGRALQGEERWGGGGPRLVLIEAQPLRSCFTKSTLA